MPTVVAFPTGATPDRPRLLGDKLQEIARRSPLDLLALDALADLVLARLNARDTPRPRQG